MTEMIIAGKDKDGNMVEPLRGLRFYEIDLDLYNPTNSGIFLRGGYGGAWLTVEQRASCAGDYGRCRQHLLAGTHACGFYMRTDYKELANYQFARPIYADCIAWGAADIWDKGARVEYVRIMALNIVDKRFVGLQDKLSKQYKVPVGVEIRI